MQDGKTPMIISVSGITLNIVISILFINVFGGDHRALALAASIAANAMGFAALGFAQHRAKGIITKEFVICVVKIIVSAVIMSCAVKLVDTVCADFSVFIRVALGGLTGVITYLACTCIVGVDEVRDIANKVLKR